MEQKSQLEKSAISDILISMEPQQNILTCPVCHQPILPSYYFCPNCGTKINQTPLSTSVMTQVGIYAFSIILPWILYIMISKWPALKYAKSKDPKTRRIGIIAITLLVLSTILTIYLAYVWTQSAIQSSVNSINTDFGP